MRTLYLICIALTLAYVSALPVGEEKSVDKATLAKETEKTASKTETRETELPELKREKRNFGLRFPVAVPYPYPYPVPSYGHRYGSGGYGGSYQSGGYAQRGPFINDFDDSFIGGGGLFGGLGFGGFGGLELGFGGPGFGIGGGILG